MSSEFVLFTSRTLEHHTDNVGSSSCPSKQQCYEDVYGMEWDPSYEDDFMDWVGDDFWDLP